MWAASKYYFWNISQLAIHYSELTRLPNSILAQTELQEAWLRREEEGVEASWTHTWIVVTVMRCHAGCHECHEWRDTWGRNFTQGTGPPGLLDMATIDEWDPNWECQRPWQRYEDSKNGAQIRSSRGWVISGSELEFWVGSCIQRYLSCLTRLNDGNEQQASCQF